MGFLHVILAMTSALSCGILDIDLSSRGTIQDFSYGNGIIYASLRADRGTEQRSGVIALNSETAEELWFYSIPDIEIHEEVYPLQIKIYGEHVYVHLVNLGILCLSADTANQIFIWESPSWNHWPPICSEDRLYVSSYGNVAMLNALTGEQLWEYSVDSDPIDIPCPISDIHFSGGRLYAGSIYPYLRCLDADTGDPIWMTEEPWRSRHSSYLKIEDAIYDLVIVSAIEAELAVLKASSGELVMFLDQCHYLDGDSRALHREVRGGRLLRIPGQIRTRTTEKHTSV